MSATRTETPNAASPPRRVLEFLLTLPNWLITTLFFVVPIGFLVVVSFASIDYDTGEIVYDWTFGNYTRLGDAIYFQAFVRSIGLTLVATLGCLVIGYPTAYVISQTRGRAQTWLLIGVIVPFWTSFVVRVYAWLDLLKPSGLVTGNLIDMGVLDESTDLRYTSFAVFIGMVYTYLPLMILPIYATLERLDTSILEAAADHGMTRTRIFWKIVVPLSMPGVMAGSLLVGIPALGEYTIPAILGGQKTLMLGSLISNQFVVLGNFAYGSAIATALMLLVMGGLVLLAKSRRLVSGAQL